MAIATIYDLDGNIVCDGLQSGAVCNQAINTAREHARETRRSVIVEDWGTRECYRVTPAGHVWRPPHTWEVPDFAEHDAENADRRAAADDFARGEAEYWSRNRW